MVLYSLHLLSLETRDRKEIDKRVKTAQSFHFHNSAPIKEEGKDRIKTVGSLDRLKGTKFERRKVLFMASRVDATP